MKRTHIILSVLLFFVLLLTACTTIVADPSADPTETQSSTKATQTDPTTDSNSTDNSGHTDVTDPSESAVQTETTNLPETVDPDQEFKEYILSRNPVPEEEYSYTIVCTPVLDPVGFAAQYPCTSVIESVDDLSFENPQLYDGFYSDDQCPVSHNALMAHYTEEFFADHVLICVTVRNQNGTLPEVARIDIGEPIFLASQVLVYIDNVVENPDEQQRYIVYIEFPRNYINFDGVHPMFVVTAVDNTSSYEDYWVWETAESTGQTEATNPPETVDPDQEFKEYILSRTPIPEEEYSYTIVCTPVLDPVGFAYRKLPASYVIDSIESLTPLTPELYNGFYTDDQCPISYDSLCTHYDEEFFRNHILMVVVVEAQNRMLPQIARIDLGIPTVKTAQIIAYVDNTVESPEDPQMYRIFIELPRSYVNFDEDPFYALTDAVDRSYSNNYWVWETAE